jgi:hypothetical protein
MTTRKAIAVLALMIGILCIPALCQSGDAEAPYKLTIKALETGSIMTTTDEPEAMSGFEVRLKVTVTNLSDHQLVCCGGGGWGSWDYLYYIRDGGDHPLKPRAFDAEKWWSSPGGSYALDPGQTWTGIITLNPDDGPFPGFDLTRPDTYTVQLGWPANPSSGREEVVKSNVMKITVTERKPFMLMIDGYADGKSGGQNFVARPGSNIGINIEKRNISPEEIDCFTASNNVTGLDDKYEYVIRDSNGDPVPPRAIPQPDYPYTRGHDRTRPCKPGESASSGSVNLTKVYDMSQPGTYTIQISQRVSDNLVDGEVKSNKVTVTVTP